MTKYFAPILLVAAAAIWSRAQAPAATANAPTTVPTTAASEPKEATPAVKVQKIVFGTGVENREAVGAATSFGRDVGQVFCWTKLDLPVTPANVTYVWSLNGKPVYKHPMYIKTSGRWWASKKVQPGDWKVDVQSESGESLASAEFKSTVETPTEPSTAPSAKPAAPTTAPAQPNK